jgi:hypothetical protein
MAAGGPWRVPLFSALVHPSRDTLPDVFLTLKNPRKILRTYSVIAKPKLAKGE